MSLVETSLEEFVLDLDASLQAEVALGLQTIVLDPVWGESFGPIFRLDDTSTATDLYLFAFGRREAEAIVARRGERLPSTYEMLVNDMVQGLTSPDHLAGILIEALDLVPDRWRFNTYYRREVSTDKKR